MSMRSFAWLCLLLLLSGAWGCTQQRAAGVYESTRAAVVHADDLGMLLLEARLAPAALSSSKVTVEQAQQLRMLLRLTLADGDMKSYGPRVTVDSLLAEVVARGEAVPRSVLNERLRQFISLAVLRPDGYLALALTGNPIQCVGPVQVRESTLQAGDFKVGIFYASEGGTFREVPSLRAQGVALSGQEVLAGPR
jgi:hypothetical protein